MEKATALIVVNDALAVEWFAHKTFLEWTLDSLKRVTALEDKIAVGVLPALWEEVIPHVRHLTKDGRAIQFPGAGGTLEEIAAEFQLAFPDSKQFILTTPNRPLFPAEKYEAMFAATEKHNLIVPGRTMTVRQVLPNGRALRNQGLWEATGIAAFGVGPDASTVEVDLTALLDAADPVDRQVLTKLVEG